MQETSSMNLFHNLSRYKETQKATPSANQFIPNHDPAPLGYHKTPQPSLSQPSQSHSQSVKFSAAVSSLSAFPSTNSLGSSCASNTSGVNGASNASHSSHNSSAGISSMGMPSRLPQKRADNMRLAPPRQCSPFSSPSNNNTSVSNGSSAHSQNVNQSHAQIGALNKKLSAIQQHHHEQQHQQQGASKEKRADRSSSRSCSPASTGRGNTTRSSAASSQSQAASQAPQTAGAAEATVRSSSDKSRAKIRPPRPTSIPSAPTAHHQTSFGGSYGRIAQTTCNNKGQQRVGKGVGNGSSTSSSGVSNTTVSSAYASSGTSSVSKPVEKGLKRLDGNNAGLGRPASQSHPNANLRDHGQSQMHQHQQPQSQSAHKPGQHISSRDSTSGSSGFSSTSTRSDSTPSLCESESLTLMASEKTSVPTASSALPAAASGAPRRPGIPPPKKRPSSAYIEQAASTASTASMSSAANASPSACNSNNALNASQTAKIAPAQSGLGPVASAPSFASRQSHGLGPAASQTPSLASVRESPSQPQSIALTKLHQLHEQHRRAGSPGRALALAHSATGTASTKLTQGADSQTNLEREAGETSTGSREGADLHRNNIREGGEVREDVTAPGAGAFASSPNVARVSPIRRLLQDNVVCGVPRDERAARASRTLPLAATNHGTACGEVRCQKSAASHNSSSGNCGSSQQPHPQTQNNCEFKRSSKKAVHQKAAPAGYYIAGERSHASESSDKRDALFSVNINVMASAQSLPSVSAANHRNVQPVGVDEERECENVFGEGQTNARRESRGEKSAALCQQENLTSARDDNIGAKSTRAATQRPSNHGDQSERVREELPSDGHTRRFNQNRSKPVLFLPTTAAPSMSSSSSPPCHPSHHAHHAHPAQYHHPHQTSSAFMSTCQTNRRSKEDPYSDSECLRGNRSAPVNQMGSMMFAYTEPLRESASERDEMCTLNNDGSLPKRCSSNGNRTLPYTINDTSAAKYPSLRTLVTPPPTPSSATMSSNHIRRLSKNSELRGSAASLLSGSSNISMTEEKQAGEIKKLKCELARSNDKVTTLTTQLITNTQMIAAFEQSLASMTARLRQLMVSTEHKDLEIAKLRAALETLRKEYEQMNNDVNKQVLNGESDRDRGDGASIKKLKLRSSSRDRGDGDHSPGWLRGSITRAFRKGRARQKSGESFSDAETASRHNLTLDAFCSVPCTPLASPKGAHIEEDSEELATLKSQLCERDRTLTDIRLESLATAHRIEGMQEVMSRTRAEVEGLREENRRLQRLVQKQSIASLRSSSHSHPDLTPSETNEHGNITSFEKPLKHNADLGHDTLLNTLMRLREATSDNF